MSFGTLALICLAGFAGPLLSAAGRGVLPVVVGELLAGIFLGRTGIEAIDPANPTLAFLAEIGFAMLMFAAGMSVPLRERGMGESIRKGAYAAALVAGLAVGSGLLVAQIAGAGHPAIYAVLVASGSAAVVLPVLQERDLSGVAALTVMAQVTVADIGATVAVPLVLDPSRTGRVLVGSAIVAVCALALLAAAKRMRTRAEVRELRRLGHQRHWAVDLRLALIVLFGLAWLTQHSGASLLIAGFGAGLVVASIGGPKRLSNEVLGIAGGFFIPLFFVVLGARLDLRGLFSDPELVALVAVLAALNVLVHVDRRPAHAPAPSRRHGGLSAARRALGDGGARPATARAHPTAGGGDHRRGTGEHRRLLGGGGGYGARASVILRRHNTQRLPR
jgi:Kef-type K+ transport system membrane component KefB